MSDKLIEKAWVEYRTNLMPAGCSLVQLEETKKAFYAGSSALLDILLKAVGQGHEPTEADLFVMDGINRELLEFFQLVLVGKSGT